MLWLALQYNQVTDTRSSNPTKTSKYYVNWSGLWPVFIALYLIWKVNSIASFFNQNFSRWNLNLYPKFKGPFCPPMQTFFKCFMVFFQRLQIVLTSHAPTPLKCPDVRGEKQHFEICFFSLGCQIRASTINRQILSASIVGLQVFLEGFEGLKSFFFLLVILRGLRNSIIILW